MVPRIHAFKTKTVRDGQMNRVTLVKVAPEAIPRDDLNSAYEGKENRGPSQKKKDKVTARKGRRLPDKTDRTPIR